MHTSDHLPDYELTEADLAEYRERGYWRSPKLYSDSEIAAMRAAVERVCVHGERDTDNWSWFGDTKDKFAAVGPTVVRQVTNAWWINHAIREVATSPRLGRFGAAFMGTDEVRLWHDQAIWKPPAGDAEDVSGNVGWHQDYAHWQCSSTQNMCTAWIALQDTDLTNGGMRTIVGSHKWGLQKDADTFGHKDLRGLQEKYSAGRDWIDEPCILRAGEVSFHHSLCFHGSGPNLSSDPRLCLISHMMPADCALRSDADARWHLNCVLLGPGAAAGTPFAGPYFPRLWPSAAADS